MGPDAGARERLGVLAPVLLLVEQHDVRRELDDAPNVRILRTADLFDSRDALGRVHAVLGDADELVAAAEVEDQLGQAGAEGDDAHALSGREYTDGRRLRPRGGERDRDEVRLPVLALCAGPLQAQTTWYVDVNATPPGLGTQASPYASIQYAHDQAATLVGDTLLVLPGTYNENLLLQKQITIASTQGPDATFLTPAAAGPIVRLFGPPDQYDLLNLIGFTITGAYGPAITAAVRSGEGSLWNCVIRGNRGVDIGGVETIYDARLFDCTVVDNDWGVEAGSIDAVWMTNTIVWANTTNMDVSIVSPWVMDVSYCAGGPFPNAYGTGNQVGDPGMWSTTYHDYRLAPGSPCIDAGDPALFDPDGTRSDIGYYAYDALYAPIASYGAGKLNSDGCVPQIAGGGLCSASDPNPFLITASLMLPGRSSLLVYGLAEASLPFQGGTLCVAAPLRVIGSQLSAGSGSCGGSCSFDFNTRVQSGADPALVPGVLVFAQWMQRDPVDPAGFQSGLSDALRFGIVP